MALVESSNKYEKQPNLSLQFQFVMRKPGEGRLKENGRRKGGKLFRLSSKRTHELQEIWILPRRRIL